MNQEESDLELEKLNKTLKVIYGKNGYVYRSLWHEKSYALVIVGATYNFVYRGPAFPTIKEAIYDCRVAVARLLNENAHLVNDLISQINELQCRKDEFVKLLLLL